MSPDSLCFWIITEWMPNGNVIEYARSNPEANRLRLVCLFAISPRIILFANNFWLSGVASGVAYLHELSVVHGDLKGASPTFLTHRSPH